MQREPVFNLPGVVLAIILALAAIHGLRDYVLDDAMDATVMRTFAFVPGRFAWVFDPDGVADALGSAGGRALDEQARFFLGDGRPQWWTPVTYAALHADWVHLGVNSMWLAAFGTPVARRIGAIRFLALLAITAIAGAMTHMAFHLMDFSPVVGASASVSGAMAAAIRFIFQPHAPLGEGGGFASPSAAAYRQPALSVAQTLVSSRTLPFILLWFVVNFLFGAFGTTLGISEAPIAWEAHAGGFLAGLLLFSLFDPRAPAGEWRAENGA